MRNWAHLPEDLLNLILSNLFGRDRHTFGLVCRSWNVVASISPYRYYSPCLMYYQRRNHMWKFYQYNNFFSLEWSEFKNTEVHCSKYGWLLMSRPDNSLFFLDPFNDLKIELPCKFYFDCTTLCFFHPPTSLDCIVVGIGTSKRVIKIYVFKHGEDEWEIIKYRHPKNQLFMVSRGTPVLHRGLVYFLDVKGNVATFNLNGGDCKRRFAFKFRCLSECWLDKIIKEHFLFKINGEEGLFAVFLMGEERKVNVFRFIEPKRMWELVKNIGDKVLYLSHASSFGDTAHLKSMANRIYFPTFFGDHNAVFYSLITEKYHSLFGDHINSGKYHPRAGSYSNNTTYSLKRLEFSAWIMPATTLDFFKD